MHQELDADSLAHERGQIQRLINPGLPVATLMENGLDDVTAVIGDVSILAAAFEVVRNSDAEDAFALLRMAVPRSRDCASANGIAHAAKSGSK